MNCIVNGCTNKGRHMLPDDEDRKSKWLAAMRISHGKLRIRVKSVRVCEEHFEDSDYNSYHTDLNCQRKTLKRHAIPSIFPWNKKRRAETTEDAIPPAEIETITLESDHESQLQPCSACLSYGRDLEPLGDLTDIYCTLVPGLDNLSDVLVCWECRAALQRCASFQKQAARAQAILALTQNGTLPKITDNSRSPSIQDKDDVACICVDSDVEANDITASDVQTIVPEDRRSNNDCLNAMNVNTKTSTKKRKKQNPLNQEMKTSALNVNTKKVVKPNSSVHDTGAMSVEIEVPGVPEEPMCDIEDIKLEVKDPLDTKFAKHGPNNFAVIIQTEFDKTAPTNSLKNKMMYKKKYWRVKKRT